MIWPHPLQSHDHSATPTLKQLHVSVSSAPMLNYNDYPQLVPGAVTGSDGQPVRTTTSFMVDFTLPNVIGENGPVDR